MFLGLGDVYIITVVLTVSLPHVAAPWNWRAKEMNRMISGGGRIPHMSIYVVYLVIV